MSIPDVKVPLANGRTIRLGIWDDDQPPGLNGTTLFDYIAVDDENGELLEYLDFDDLFRRACEHGYDAPRQLLAYVFQHLLAEPTLPPAESPPDKTRQIVLKDD